MFRKLTEKCHLQVPSSYSIALTILSLMQPVHFFNKLKFSHHCTDILALSDVLRNISSNFVHTPQKCSFFLSLTTIIILILIQFNMLKRIFLYFYILKRGSSSGKCLSIKTPLLLNMRTWKRDRTHESWKEIKILRRLMRK